MFSGNRSSGASRKRSCSLPLVAEWGRTEFDNIALCCSPKKKKDYSNELGDSSFEFHSFIAVLRLFLAKVIPQSVEEEYCGVLSEQWRKRSMLWYRRAVFLFFVQATLMSLSAVWFCTDQPRRSHVAETGVKYCSSIEERCARLGPGSGLACDTPG